MTMYRAVMVTSAASDTAHTRRWNWSILPPRGRQWWTQRWR